MFTTTPTTWATSGRTLRLTKPQENSTERRKSYRPLKHKKMKGIVIKLLIISLIGLQIKLDCINRIMFTSKYPCERKVEIKYLFDKNNLYQIKEFLYHNKAQKSSILLDCNKNPYMVHGRDTLIAYGQSIIKIKYKLHYADSSYSKLLAFCNQPVHDNRLFGFFKPGKIVCMNSKQNELIIINVNSCANMRKFNKLISCIRDSKEFTKAFGVRCGVYNGLIKIK